MVAVIVIVAIVVLLGGGYYAVLRRRPAGRLDDAERQQRLADQARNDWANNSGRPPGGPGGGMTPGF